MTSPIPLYEQPEIHHRRGFLLGVMCLSLVMVVMSVSGINVAFATSAGIAVIAGASVLLAGRRT